MIIFVCTNLNIFNNKTNKKKVNAHVCCMYELPSVSEV